MKISIVVALNKNSVIGDNGKIPWKSREDLKKFKEITIGHHVLMGRKTFDSIGKPLPNRENLVITNSTNLKVGGCIVFSSIQHGIDHAKEKGEDELFIIGGGQIYSETLPICDKIYETIILDSQQGDTFFPVLKPNEWTETNSEEHLEFDPPLIFRTLERR